MQVCKKSNAFPSAIEQVVCVGPQNIEHSILNEKTFSCRSNGNEIHSYSKMNFIRIGIVFNLMVHEMVLLYV